MCRAQNYSGQILWNTAADGFEFTGGGNGVFCYETVDSQYVVVDINSGNYLYTLPVSEASVYISPNQPTLLFTNSYVRTPFSGSYTQLSCYGLQTGNQVWSGYPLPEGYIINTFVIGVHAVTAVTQQWSVPGFNSSVITFEPSTGNLISSILMLNCSVTSIAVSKRSDYTAYTLSYNATGIFLAALDTRLGRVRWSKTLTTNSSYFDMSDLVLLEDESIVAWFIEAFTNTITGAGIS